MKDKNTNIKPQISRRRFFKNAAGLGVGALATSQLGVAASPSEPSCKTAGCDYDVIVVGGGFAGVSAARDCVENGYKTLLIEARNRLGGRTFSSEIDGMHIEFGGTWVHHTQPFVWAEIQRYGLDIIETKGANPDQLLMNFNGKIISLTEQQTIEAMTGWSIFTSEARQILPRPYDLLHNKKLALAADKISALDHLNSLKLTPLQHQFTQGMLETVCHSSADKVSYLDILRLHLAGGGYFPTFMDAVARFQLKDGTGALIDEIIKDATPEIKLSTPIKSVEDLGKTTKVTTARGETITAATVINCLPMNTISQVQFSPSLPKSVIKASNEKHPGSGVKLYITVEGDVGNISAIAPGKALNFVMTYKQDKSKTVLLALGSGSDDLDIYDDESVEQALRQIVPNTKVISTLTYDWNNDPYSLGTWATYRPQWVEKHYSDFQKDYGRLFFASGDHGEGWRSTIDGAIGAGVRAAQNVKRLLA